METAILAKRIWIYIINTIIYYGVGFACALPFLLVLKLHPVFYVMIGVGFSTVISFIFSFIALMISRGYTFASAILSVKYVSSDGSGINNKQILIRASLESVAIFIFFDFIYFVKNQTERGVIDRLSDSFAIDNNL